MSVEIDRQTVIEILREEIKEGLKPALRLAALREKILLNGREVEELYGISERALRCSRYNANRNVRRGPRFHRSGSGKIFYEHADIIEFIKSSDR